MRTEIDRRELLLGAVSASVAALWPSSLVAERATTRLILLGTGGGPRPRKVSSAPAQVILINNTAYVIDCGDGVARQLVFANVPLPRVRHIFLTHQHSDQRRLRQPDLARAAPSISPRRISGAPSSLAKISWRSEEDR